MPASVFPQTNFPRVVILIDNGVMPADEMMATITRPVEEAMKNIPGTTNIRSTTGRGSAAVNVFFDWSTDMVQSELYVLGRLAQIRSSLPATVEFAVHRLTFSAFPILGISLTSKTRNISELWETARYRLNPRFLRIQGVARVNIVGGRVPEYHVVVDPAKLEAYHLTLDQVSRALTETNQFTSAGMHEENRQLYLAVVDSRLREPGEIEKVVVAWSGKSPVHVHDIATVRRGYAPQFNLVTAEGTEAVLMNVYSQADGNTVAIADALHEELKQIRRELPADMKLAFFYDQSLFVREGVRQRLGVHYPGPDPFRLGALRIPAEPLRYLRRRRGNPGDRAFDAGGHADVPHELQSDDARGHRGGHRHGDRRCHRGDRGDPRQSPGRPRAAPTPSSW